MSRPFYIMPSPETTIRYAANPSRSWWAGDMSRAEFNAKVSAEADRMQSSKFGQLRDSLTSSEAAGRPPKIPRTRE